MTNGARVNPLVVGMLTIVAMLATVAGILVSGIPGGPQIPLLSGQPMILKVELADADGLAPHAMVGIAGVKIGEVRNLDAEGNRAIATLAIDPAYGDIHRDARALLRPHGLFGPKYIEIDPGTATAPRLHDGDVIPVEDTVQPVDLDQILHELQAPERQNVKTALIELGKAAAGRGSDVNGLVAAANTLTQTLQSPVVRLDQVSPNLSDMLVQDAAFNAAFSQAPLDQLVAYNDQVLSAFAQTSAQLEDLLVHADNALTNLDAALNGESGNIRTFLETAPSTIDRLDRFNDLLSVFAANFTGKEPGVSNIESGIRDAIVNPESAFSKFDACDPSAQSPGSSSDPPTCTPVPGAKPGPDGKIHQGERHYARVEVFNFAPGLPAAPSVLCTLPLVGPNPVGPALGCTAAAGILPSAPSLASSIGQPSLATLADFLTP